MRPLAALAASRVLYNDGHQSVLGIFVGEPYAPSSSGLEEHDLQQVNEGVDRSIRAL